VLRKHPGGIEILGIPAGIERLGGVDFDESILSYVNYASGGALAELDLGDPQTGVALARLRQDCVLAKEALSIDIETTIPVFLPQRHFEVRLTRTELEDMIRAPVESTIGTLVRTLQSAQVEPGQLSAVLLVGGSSRIPLVSQMISEELGRPTIVDAHPKYAVALGAAALARSLATAQPETAQLETAQPSAVPPEVGSRPRPPIPAQRSAEPTVVAAVAAVPGARAPQTRTPIGAGNAGGLEGTRSTAADGAPSAARFGPQHSHSVPRPNAPPPSTPPPAPALGGRGPSRPNTLAVVGAVVAVLAIIVGGILTVDRFSDRRPAAASPATSVVPEPANPTAELAPSPAVAVPVPSIGPTIPVGATPGFAVVSPNGRQIYVANRTAGVITVVDTAVNKVTATIPVPAGPPQFLAFSPDGRRVYVSIWNNERTIAAVSVLDATTNTIVATIPVDTRPYLAAVTRDGKLLYVPNHDSGVVAEIDTATNAVATTIKVAPNPHWVEFSRDGTRAYTANHESNLVSVIDTATNSIIAEVPVEKSPHSVAVHPTRPLVGNVNYDSASVTMIDTNTNQVVATIKVRGNPQDITWSGDGRFAYTANVTDHTVSVISAETMTVTATIPTGRSPTSVAVVPDGSTGYVTNLDDGTLTVLNLAAG
jgi:YVTN family beta-propeller protein